MPKPNRVNRLNSLLREVLAEVLREELRNPKIAPLTTVMSVTVSSDIQHAKVYISVIGSEEEKKNTIDALQNASGFIAVIASKKVVLRYFPALVFILDSSVDKYLRIDSILQDLQKEQDARGNSHHQ
jgi:ribosome-binding factor A